MLKSYPPPPSSSSTTTPPGIYPAACRRWRRWRSQAMCTVVCGQRLDGWPRGHARHIFPQVDLIAAKTNLGFAGGRIWGWTTYEAANCWPSSIPMCARAPTGWRRWRGLCRTMQRSRQPSPAASWCTRMGSRSSTRAGSSASPWRDLGHRGRGTPDTGAYQQAQAVPYVAGGALAITRAGPTKR